MSNQKYWKGKCPICGDVRIGQKSKPKSCKSEQKYGSRSFRRCGTPLTDVEDVTEKVEAIQQVQKLHRGQKDGLTHDLRFNGIPFMSGDELSVMVVYGNLTGKNFENPPVWRTLTHRNYMDYMENLLGFKFEVGRLEVGQVGMPATFEHAFT